MPLKIIFIIIAVFASRVLLAGASKEVASERDDFSMMGALSDWELHDLQDESWNAYAQATYISGWKNAFPAAYTNLNGAPNSLSPKAERSFTATFSAFMGFKGWQGAEFYAVPEMISEEPLSGLKGLGGSIQNFELQKNGTVSATWYRAPRLLSANPLLWWHIPSGCFRAVTISGEL
ncbi:MAG: hypothetical protein ABL903_15315 [Methylococcales bacterium]